MTVASYTYKTALFLLLFLFGFDALAAAEVSEPQAATEIKVVARKYAFIPSTITVRKGEPVRLVVTSEDVDHGLAIGEFGVDQAVRARETKVIEFTPDKEGQFRISCSVFCGEGHPEMEATLVVTAAGAAQAASTSAGGLQVVFDETEPGVVYVESNGERIKIDTTTKSIVKTGGVNTAGSKPSPTPTAEATASRQESRRAPEPYDYRLVNVPTPKRVPKGSLNVHFTHRFAQPVRQDDVPVKEEARVLFGFDSSSASSLGFTYGFTDRLYGAVYRSPLCQPGLCRTVEVGLGYHLLDEAGRSPVALSAYASVEGDDNFSENFTYNLQAMLARSVTRHVTLFFSPAVHFKSNGNHRFNPRPEDFFPPASAADDFELGTHTGSFGFGVNARVRPTVSLLFEYTPRVGFKLGQVLPLFNEDFSIAGFENRSEAAIGFGIEKRLGRHSFAFTFSNTQATTTSRYNSSNLVLPPSRFTIGFNLFRRLL
ncbi:MAG TPA: DUF5777 family beta-barrel protein [Blastocatellia bacterium]|nr:DUF5777 family beta-barrel protein [Blastocatellia bacterium]